MKKIIQINTVVNKGSTGRIAEEIGQILIQNNWQSYIAFGRNDRKSESIKLKIGSQIDIYKHVVKTRLFDNHGLSSASATRKLLREVELIKPDIIHLHNIHGYYIHMGLLFKYLQTTSIPVVWTLHDCWPITGHCVYFDYVKCEKWQTECFSCPQKHTYPQSIWLDRSNRNYNLKKRLFSSLGNLTIIPVSNWLSGIIEQSYLSQYPIKVIHNGIDINSFNPQKNNIKEKYRLKGKSIVLGVANDWSPRKGLADFQELSKQLDDNYQIILIGLNSKQLNRLPKNIIGISKTENIKELAKFYSAADVFVNPTWEDNFPTTNLEAQACGTPVITYNTGGSIEAISRKTGYIVEKGNIKYLIDKIHEISYKGKKYFSANCIEHAQKHFDKSQKYLEYLDLYESLLNNI